jgi:hypothetical protein
MANTNTNIDNTTLGKSTTQSFFKDPDGYQKMVERWSELSNDKESREALTSSHHLLYLILRGKSLKKAYTPVTSEKKLASGFSTWDGYLGARGGLLRYDWTARGYVVSTSALCLFDSLLDVPAVSEFILARLDDKEPGYKEVSA